MPLRVRFARAEDYPGAATIHNQQNEPGFHTDAQRMLRADRRSAEHDPAHRRLIAESNDEVVGTGYFRANWAGTVQPGRFWVGLFTGPEWRGRGVDSEMLRFALEEVGEGARELASCIREDFVAAAGYLDGFGFEERYRSWGSHLDLRSFAFSRFEKLTRELEGADIRLVPYGELTDRDRDERLVALQRELEEDALFFEPIIPKRAPEVTEEEILQEATTVAVDRDGGYLGVASISGEAGEPNLGGGFTGVARKFRNRGLATALKARTISVAQRLGGIDLNAGGGGADSPMKRVNEKLGFEIEPAWVTFISDR